MTTTKPADNAGHGLPPADTPTARTAGMPLGARRLALIGGLCIPVGLVAGPYLLGLQLVAVAGAVAVAIALSYRLGERWFSPWSWLTAAAGALWIAATLGYWATIVAAAEASAALAAWSTVLFNVGVGAMVLMAAGALAGATARYRSGRLPSALSA
ncbi:hypothetical protein [Arthrobacter sp. ISL-69]|uniref:hypothetical protein n=1 Tax=Arthrobacter sp. ISL-69 TaxID=2819113 RepID=UPI0020357D6C|nr:hypothetical protein [Arthrobacter sp. ISL-69]